VEPRSEAAFRAYGEYFTRFEAAPVVIVALYRSLTVLSEPRGRSPPRRRADACRRMEERSGLIGVSMALQNLLLMAHELGLGASGMTGPLVAADRLRALLRGSPRGRSSRSFPSGSPPRRRRRRRASRSGGSRSGIEDGA